MSVNVDLRDNPLRNYTFAEVHRLTGIPTWKIRELVVRERRVGYQRYGRSPLMLASQIEDLVALCGVPPAPPPPTNGPDELAAERARHQARRQRAARKAS